MKFFYPAFHVPGAEAPILICRSCGLHVASEFALVEIQGRPFRSTYRNPFGLEFEILTVERVSNLLLTSEPTREHSWFPGYAWRMASCSHCLTHLGWQFAATRPALMPASFYGLWAEKLVSQAPLEEGRMDGYDEANL